ncbi:hypothetical protein BT63DRAFT_481636 [Microthyrium microscopicum]|uniref:Sphingolipid long chain base-responsive protein PIL1 n=1 Tax=Microthyrium microscopicum TaxID=703497 RepID=A0A6A6U6Y0_9PEZI|nr:hypothetical protein BT63DRAFT_481636 [Microthyrium microscopicum]
MHRTYSMRSSRAPTASELQTPPPPTSTTKQHRIFGKGNLGEPSPASLGDSFARNQQYTPPAAHYQTTASAGTEIEAGDTPGIRLRRSETTLACNDETVQWTPAPVTVMRSSSPSSFQRRKPLKKLMPRRIVRNTWHTFRSRTAGAFGPDLAKKLTQLVKMEKNLMRSMELVARERMEVAQQLSIWGESGDDDVSDITDKLGVLLYEIGELEDQNVDRYDQYRVTMKSIRNIEISVQPSRDRKQKITDQIAHLKYKEPTSPKIEVLEQELVRAEAESLVAEAQLSNITREKIKGAFNYQFDAIQENCEKLAMIAGYGKHLLELIDDTPVTPGETRDSYDGYEASRAIIQDCEDSLTNWVPQNAAVSSKLSVRSRTLSQRRAARHNQEGVDLSGQDAPMDHDSYSQYEHDDDAVSAEHDGGLDAELEKGNSERRGREDQRVAEVA